MKKGELRCITGFELRTLHSPIFNEFDLMSDEHKTDINNWYKERVDKLININFTFRIRKDAFDGIPPELRNAPLREFLFKAEKEIEDLINIGIDVFKNENSRVELRVDSEPYLNFHTETYRYCYLIKEGDVYKRLFRNGVTNSAVDEAISYATRVVNKAIDEIIRKIN